MDPQEGVIIVQQMLEFLRDAFDKYTGSSAKGSATVPATATTVAVSIPSSVGGSYAVGLTPLLNPGGTFWVTGKTASGFTINLQVAAPVGGIPFDWTVRGA